jgi:hydroxymethylpyrimidine pyrophosphatase-like HAD family hydrolase
MRKNFLFVNFTIGKVPWPNQVHHVLNQSSLKDILNTLKHTRKAAEQLLYKEFYNINHKDNMVILPSTNQFARITGLPKHGGHTNYNERIFDELKQAFNDIKTIDDELDEECKEEPDIKSLRDDLVAISKEWYQKILAVVPENRKLKVATEHLVKKVDEIS